MYLDYISFNNLMEIKNTNQTDLKAISFDTEKSELILDFNNPIEYNKLFYFRKNIKIHYNNYKLRIIDVNRSATFKVVKNDKLFTNRILLKLNDKNIRNSGMFKDSKEEFKRNWRVEFNELLDINGFYVENAPPFEFYQFREIFSQEIFEDKELPTDKVFTEKFKILSKSKLNSFDIKKTFWVNSPLKTTEKND